MSKDFYRAFEDKHRGSRELIKNRFRVYMPFILPLKEIYPDGLALDIGCGRGEWLELLKDNSIAAQGVDFDEGMLKACKDISLDVTNADGVAYLQAQADHSITIVSAFHVVEHISFSELQSFVRESLRVLKPGGLLIMETPNPENIKVATENFYLDPTHIKPIPSALLSFLPEFYGFERTKILKLQENKDLENQENVSLLNVMADVSPDYAVVAQKGAGPKILEQFDVIFGQRFGLTLETLSKRFENRLQKIEAKVEQAEAKVEQAEAKAEQAELKLNAIYNSYFWRVTKPVRWILRILKGNGDKG